MADGWTLSGSNDGDNWTVLYTGMAEDYDPITYTWWRFDLPGNTEAFQYYKLWASGYYEEQDQTIIQMSVLALSGNLPAPPEADVVVDDVPAEAPPPPVVAAPEAPKEGAVYTGDLSMIIFLGVLTAAGVVIFKKKSAAK
jgi:hypothetical protein